MTYNQNVVLIAESLVSSWFNNTHSYTAEAAEFGAVWAEASISQFLHTNEAAKHLGDALQRNRSLTRTAAAEFRAEIMSITPRLRGVV